MYISTGSGNALKVIELQPDGSMMARPELELDLGARTGAMAYARSTRRLFIGVDQDIATVSLDQAGVPSLAGTTVGSGNPVYLEVAQDESILVSAYFGLDQLKTHNIALAPPHAELQSLGVADEPHQAITGPGARIYVPHRTGDATHWYTLSAQGTLALGGQLAAQSGVGPRHMAFSPSGDFAYIVNERGDSVSTHTIAGDGSLTHVETVSTIPGTQDADSNHCADLHISPDGKFLYGSNRGHDSIAMFSIGTTGLLTSLGTVATETTPREFDLSPDGRFVVVAGQGNGFLQSYRVQSDGTLTSVDRLDIGDDPRWVIID
jgi:6-phosphogluconolactonase